MQHYGGCFVLGRFAAIISVGILSSALLSHSVRADEPFSWGGFYIGAHAGYAIADRTTHLPPPFPGDIYPEDRYSWLAGALAGFNYQAGPWVAGFEFDVAGMLGDGPRQTVYQPGSPTAWHQYSSVDALATARGRIGYASNNWLFYASGGLAWAQTSATIVTTHGSMKTGHGSADATHLGWVGGAGFEYGTGKLIFRFEYLHHDLGSAEYKYDIPGGQTSADLEVDSFRAAIIYKLQ
jgi:outer membrane immunogenic protein